MKSQLFEQDKMEKGGVAGSFLLQNRHTLKVELNGEVYAKQGAMAAYQGNVEFSFHGGGVRRMLKKIVSGENLQLMKVSGRGEVFFSDFGAEVQIVQLENDSLTINTSNLLAFESTLRWDIKMVKPGIQMLAAGLSKCHRQWHGTSGYLLFWLAIPSAGQRADLCRCASCIGLVKLASN
jgi:uncharacterized protein (AIM24 family)